MMRPTRCPLEPASATVRAILAWALAWTGAAVAAEPKVSTPQAVVPKAVVPKAVAPKASEPKAVVPKASEPQAVVPKAAPPKAADPREVVEKATAAAGGKDKLLTLFKYTERLNVSADPAKPGTERTSTVQPPAHWWLGKRDRVTDDKEPAIFLVWGWTLGALHDPKSKLTGLPEIVEEGKPAVGVRVAETIDPPLDLYFDQADFRLVRIDWRSDVHRFSDIREHDGVRYPAKVVGYKKSSGKPWYFCEILKLERVAAPPVPAPR